MWQCLAFFQARDGCFLLSDGDDSVDHFDSNHVLATFDGALRKGPPFHGSRSSREINIQNASSQMGGREVTR